VSLTLPATVRTKAEIGGAFVNARDGETFDSFAPDKSQVIAQVAACGEADVDLAMAAARAAFKSGTWSAKSLSECKVILLKFANPIEENAEESAVYESIDIGKPITECRTFDVPDVVNTMHSHAEAADKVLEKSLPRALTPSA
jgi:gamma-glutamyl-gamma-aminobutyraldehyde dehydrogenase